jgi:hypothetical protein
MAYEHVCCGDAVPVLPAPVPDPPFAGPTNVTVGYQPAARHELGARHTSTEERPHV